MVSKWQERQLLKLLEMNTCQTSLEKSSNQFPDCAYVMHLSLNAFSPWCVCPLEETTLLFILTLSLGQQS